MVGARILDQASQTLLDQRDFFGGDDLAGELWVHEQSYLNRARSWCDHAADRKLHRNYSTPELACADELLPPAARSAICVRRLPVLPNPSADGRGRRAGSLYYKSR